MHACVMLAWSCADAMAVQMSARLTIVVKKISA